MPELPKVVSNQPDRKQKLKTKIQEEFRISWESKQKLEPQWFRIYKMYNQSLEKLLSADKRRPHIYVPKIFPFIETEAARYIIGLFQNPPFIKCDPRNSLGLKNKQSVQSAIEYYLQAAKIFRVMVEAVKIVLMYGTVGIVPSWVIKKRKIKRPLFAESSEERQDKRNMLVFEDEEIYRGLEFNVYEPWAIYPYHPFATDELSADSIIVEDWISESFYNQKVKEGVYDDIPVSKLRSGSGVKPSLPEQKRQRLGHPVPVGAESLIQRWKRISDDQIITVLGQEYIAQELDNPYPFAHKPFIRGIKTYHPKEFFGGDSVRMVEQIQLAMNTLFNQIFAINAQIIDPIALYRRGSVNPNQILTFPMQRIGVLDPSTDVQFHKPPPMGIDPYNVYKMLSNMFDEATGFVDVKRGEFARQETATTSAILAQAADYRTRFDVRVFEEFTLAPMAEMVKLMIREWMPPEVEMSITGKNKWQTITREQLDGQFAYRCGGSEMTSNLNIDRNQVIQFFQLVMQLPFVAQNINAQKAIVREIGTMFPIKSLDEIIPEEEAPQFIEELLGGLQRGQGGGGGSIENQGNFLASENQSFAPTIQ